MAKPKPAVKKVPYTGLATPEIKRGIQEKAHDLRLPFSNLVEQLMDSYLKTGKPLIKKSLK